MGQIANKELGDDPFCKNAIVFTGKSPPVSCIVDGVQLSSGCTLGKGNIIVKDEKLAKTEFSNKDGKKIIIELNNQIKDEIDNTVNKENIISYSLKLNKRPNEELFKISRI